jgi:hypothetical protein
MKSFSVTAVMISLLLIVVTSPPTSGSRAQTYGIANEVHWINADGFQGVAGAGAGQSDQRGSLSWVNPDGRRGTEVRQSGQRSVAGGSSWANPDGTTGRDLAVQARSTMPQSAF